MANVNAARGFVPINQIQGQNPGVQRNFIIASGYNTAIYTGDPVKLAAGGGNVIELAAAGEAVVGVFMGCHYEDVSGEMQFRAYWEANETYDKFYGASVIDDPYTEFEVQVDTLTSANVGKLMDWTIAAGDPKFGTSKTYLASASAASTGAGFQVSRLSPGFHNGAFGGKNEYGAYAKAIGVFIEHVRRGVTTGAGGI